MSTTTVKRESDRLWRELQAHGDDAEPNPARGKAWDAWFAARIREGNDPSALQRNSSNLDEKIDARSLPGVGGCLIWDGAFDDGHPRVSHATPEQPNRNIHVRKYVLARAGRPVPEKRRVVVKCGQLSCVNPDHLTHETEPWTRRFSDDQVRGLFQTLSLRLGRSPRRHEWDKAGFKVTAGGIESRYGSWDNALAKAGLPPAPTHDKKSDPAEMLATLQRYARQHRIRPTTHIWRTRRPPGSVSVTTYLRHFGTWHKALEAAGLLDDQEAA